MNTLVINHAYEPLEVVSWEKAIYLLVTEKAELVAAYERFVRSVSLTMQIPKIVRLTKFAKTKRRQKTTFRKRDVFVRDGWACQYCGKGLSEKTATLDHVTPRARGGVDSWENTVASCGPCNSKKGCRTPDEAGMRLARAPRRPKNLHELALGLSGDLQAAFRELMGY